MKFFTRLFQLLLILAVLLFGIAYLLPREVIAERSIVIAKPQATVFTLIASMNRFNEWSPWYGRDPNATYTQIGTGYGVGAGIAWKGNQEVGEGSQTVTALEPYSRIEVDLDFGAEGPAKAGYLLEAVEGGTQVTWRFEADMGINPLGRYFGLLIERFLGPDYEQGLAQLQQLALTVPDGDPAGMQFEQVEVAAQTLIYVPQSTASGADAVSAGYANAYGQIVPFMAANGLAQAAAPIGIEGESTPDQYQFDAAIPVTGMVAELVPPLQTKPGYQGKTLRTVHVGAYTALADSVDGIRAYAAARGLQTNGRLWYSFVDDPTTVVEAELKTEIYLPIK